MVALPRTLRLLPSFFLTQLGNEGAVSILFPLLAPIPSPPPEHSPGDRQTVAPRIAVKIPGQPLHGRSLKSSIMKNQTPMMEKLVVQVNREAAAEERERREVNAAVAERVIRETQRKGRGGRTMRDDR